MFYCSSLFREMIQFDVRICFKWVGEKPTNEIHFCLLFGNSFFPQVNPGKNMLLINNLDF